MSSRRDFVKKAAIGTIGVSTLFNCQDSKDKTQEKLVEIKPQKKPLIISTWRHGLAANEEAWKQLKSGTSSLDAIVSGVGTASSSTIGADVSGNTNHFTSTNVAATDQTIDSPTNNFATFNRLRGLGPTMFEGNLLTETSTNTVSRSVDTNFEPPSGKWYVEVLIKVDGANSGQNATHVGVANPTFITGNEFKGHSNGVSYCMNGQKGLNNSVSDYGATYASGDVIGIAYDTDNDNITFIKNKALRHFFGIIRIVNRIFRKCTKINQRNIFIY